MLILIIDSSIIIGIYISQFSFKYLSKFVVLKNLKKKPTAASALPIVL